MFEIRLFGPLRISLEGQGLQESLPEQAGSILCYLLLNRERPMHRDVLVGHFWGDATQEKARKALRTAIWRIRSALEEEGGPPVLLAESDYVSFNTDIPYWLDVEAFKALIAEAQAYKEQSQTAEAAAALREAVGLYRADLLEGWTDEWLLYARVHLQSLYLTALTELMEVHSSMQEYHEALQYGMLILNYDPLLESVHRHMMRLHYWAGNRAAAVRQYQKCEDQLVRELDIEPMEETRRLFELICDENAPEVSLPVVGRQDELPVQTGNWNLQIEPVIRQLKVVQDQLDIARSQLEMATGARIP